MAHCCEKGSARQGSAERAKAVGASVSARARGYEVVTAMQAGGGGGKRR